MSRSVLLALALLVGCASGGGSPAPPPSPSAAAPSAAASSGIGCKAHDWKSCSATEGCSWLVPGCAEGGSVAVIEGCYSTTPCTPDGCPAGTACTTAIANPCTDPEIPCEACGGEVTVCM